jgi:carbon-monoxide dehydrogenase large subunit
MNDIAKTSGIGQPVRRIEDERLLTGGGCYSDDISPVGAAYAVFLRSPHAHARIRRIDTAQAAAAPHVLAVFTAADVAADKLGEIVCAAVPPPPTGTVLFRSPYPPLATDAVKFVGDRVALVVAETREAARDATELIEVEYDPLPAVPTVEAAIADGAPKVWPQAESNACFRMERGDRAAVDAAFGKAAHVVKLATRYPRIAGNAMELRSSIGGWDKRARRYNLITASQHTHRVKDALAGMVLRVPETDIKVQAFDLGGGFGLRGVPCAEDGVVLWASKKLGRPVKWTADRGEAMVADTHGRDRIDWGEVAFDADGRILAMRSEVAVNAGAYLALNAGVPSINAERWAAPYHIPLCHASVRTVFTNTNPLGPYRGTGRPESNLFLERMMDKAAAQIGIDRAELRRRNLIAPSAMPYKTPGGHTIDSGEFGRVLEDAMRLADWNGFAARRASSERAGKRRGIGMGLYVILSSSTLNPERMEIRVEPDGGFSVMAGTHASGQGHETMYAQMLASWLGQPLEAIRVFQGDTDRILMGRGTNANRSAMMGGSALRAAADNLIENGKKFAAWAMEASEADIAFESGRFVVAGTDRAMTIKEVAHKAYNSSAMPAELSAGLMGIGGFSGPPSFPNGCIVCEVEVDIDTGTVTLDRCVSVSDSGTIVNPLTLEGQIHGAIAQAVGEMLTEEVRYDENGQLLTGSFVDYAMPRADILPSMRAEFIAVPAKTNPLGIKGGSENGSAGAPPAVMNAILDALASLGVTDIPAPATPERVWRAIQQAGAHSTRPLDKIVD